MGSIDIRERILVHARLLWPVIDATAISYPKLGNTYDSTLQEEDDRGARRLPSMEIIVVGTVTGFNASVMRSEFCRDGKISGNPKPNTTFLQSADTATPEKALQQLLALTTVIIGEKAQGLVKTAGERKEVREYGHYFSPGRGTL